MGSPQPAGSEKEEHAAVSSSTPLVRNSKFITQNNPYHSEPKTPTLDLRPSCRQRSNDLNHLSHAAHILYHAICHQMISEVPHQKGSRMPEKTFQSFQRSLTQFLEDLAFNNNRDWFNANRDRYQTDVVRPVLSFIQAIKPHLMEISPHLMVEAKKSGGSLFRIYRDTRFSKDKTPYKTHVGIRFPHREFKQRTGPGLYMHIESEEVFLAAGVWHPESSALTRIRAKIDQDPEAWIQSRDDRKFKKLFRLAGDSLKTAPRGYPKDHPLIEDLRRKDFIGVHELSVSALFKDNLPAEIGRSYGATRPLLYFLAEALEVPF
jgi:uncharacterized protein (TIGR02453 family)